MNVMRLFWAVTAGCLVGLLCAQSSGTVHHPFLWDREFSQSPNIYIPETAVLDSHDVIWVLCRARMGNEGYAKQHLTHAIFRIDQQGQQLSTAELTLPLPAGERGDTSDYRLAALPGGSMGLMFNKIGWEGRGESYLGAYYTTVDPSGVAAPLQLVGGPGPEYNEFLSLTNGNLLLGGSEGALLTFDSGGKLQWKKSFRQPLLVNPDSTNLSDGNICMSVWSMGKKGALNQLQVMQLDEHGNVLHTANISALRGQVAGGPDGSCAVLYDRAPNINRAEYYLTVLDRSFTRQWTVPVPQSSQSGAQFTLVPLADGYLAQIGSVLAEFSWSGKELWMDVEARDTAETIVTPTREGFFVVTGGLNMNKGFHVKRAITTRE
jgi:hypothetical protein